MPNVSIDCADCGTPFVFGEKDQEFYAKRQFTPPKRCRGCREERKAKRAQNEASGNSQQERPERNRDRR